jgi:ComF family protein
MKILQKIINIVFPITCICCGDIGTDLCKKCLDNFPSADDDLLDWISAGYSYKHACVRKIILHLKEYPNQRLTDILVKNLYNKIFISINTNYLIIPVPVTKTRLYERGFNQAEIITRSLLPYFPTAKICTDAVIKLDTAVKQSTAKDKQSRIKNAEHVFHITKPAVIAGRDIIIADDVITSGATINSLRDELLSAGARSVKGFTVAH